MAFASPWKSLWQVRSPRRRNKVGWRVASILFSWLRAPAAGALQYGNKNNNNLSECIHVAVVGHHLMPV